MLAKLIDMLNRRSRRPLALGVVLVSARGGQDARPICFEQMRPASAWSCVLLLLATLGLGITSVQREVSLSSARSAAASVEVVASETAGTSAAPLAAELPTASKTVILIRRG